MFAKFGTHLKPQLPVQIGLGYEECDHNPAQLNLNTSKILAGALCCLRRGDQVIPGESKRKALTFLNPNPSLAGDGGRASSERSETTA